MEMNLGRNDCPHQCQLQLTKNTRNTQFFRSQGEGKTKRLISSLSVFKTLTFLILYPVIKYNIVLYNKPSLLLEKPLKVVNINIKNFDQSAIFIDPSKNFLKVRP